MIFQVIPHCLKIFHSFLSDSEEIDHLEPQGQSEERPGEDLSTGMADRKIEHFWRVDGAAEEV